MRELKRSVVHAQMKAAGFAHVNRKNGGRSFFARNWKKWPKINADGRE